MYKHSYWLPQRRKLVISLICLILYGCIWQLLLNEYVMLCYGTLRQSFHAKFRINLWKGVTIGFTEYVDFANYGNITCLITDISLEQF